MPKAFSEEEKEQIKNQILETAVELFHDKGTKSINIQELTRRAGIAQGSFYSFWKDKDALIMDVMLYRSRQKLDIAEKEFEASLHDPIGFLSESIYRYSMDLLNKCREQPVYSQSFAILSRSNSLSENRVGAIYKEFLSKLAAYWVEHRAVQSMDVQGLINVITACPVLLSNAGQFDPEYFDEIFKSFLQSTIRNYITL
ncbi:MAG: TetR/AcrR family transcriptional regulator [Lachnospiraceae bacterium]|nr:TetR/AcrR family transcriptional regulator [Clostridium sp.]MDD6179301.1 TetR/AcrR family transcriptional regulator [Clostridium sp.]MDY4820671.1 TetR/AcrR family transcriptional regulator [Lachnospiraceae bacterium]